MGEAVEYDKVEQDQFDIQKQTDLFLQAAKAKIIACGACMNIRHQVLTF